MIKYFIDRLQIKKEIEGDLNWIGYLYCLFLVKYSKHKGINMI